jgi:hypothetical protein
VRVGRNIRFESKAGFRHRSMPPFDWHLGLDAVFDRRIVDRCVSNAGDVQLSIRSIHDEGLLFVGFEYKKINGLFPRLLGGIHDLYHCFIWWCGISNGHQLELTSMSTSKLTGTAAVAGHSFRKSGFIAWSRNNGVKKVCGGNK